MSAFTLLLLSSGLNLGFRVLFHRFNFDLRWIRNYLLGYLKDSYVAAYSVDSDIIFAVIHLQLYAWWRIDGQLCTWQRIVTKKHIVSQLCLDIKQYTSTSPFNRSWKSKDVEIVGAHNSQILYWYALNVAIRNVAIDRRRRRVHRDVRKC